MINKVHAAICIAFISTAVMATPSKNMITPDKLNTVQHDYQWCLEHEIAPQRGCPVGWMGITTYPNQPATYVLYVNRYIADSSRPSDPVLFQCNTSAPVIVNPGSSYACMLPAGGSARWKVESDFLQNGADGSILYVE